VQEINPDVVTAVPQQQAALRLGNASSLSGGASTGYTAAQSPAATGSASGTEERLPVVDAAAHLTPPKLEPPPAEEGLSGRDLVAAMLTGSRPRADVLPQKGSPVASVATLLAEDGEPAGNPAAGGEEGRELSGCLIDLTAPGLRPMVVLGVGALGLRDRRKRPRQRQGEWHGNCSFY
jgi:hypothetical protein